MKIQFESSSVVIFESALFRTTSTLIISDDHIVLIDPNWFPIELQFIQNYISKLDATLKKYLFFTHSDYDHIIGYNFFKGYKTIASRNFINQKAKDTILEKIGTIDDDNYTIREYTLAYPKIDIIIEEQQTRLQLRTKEYEVGYLLGHNDNSVYLMDTHNKLLIAGDYLSNIEFPYLYHSFQAYIHSLETLTKLISSGRAAMLIPGHGDYTIEQREMKKRIEDSNQYLKNLKEHCQGKQVFDFDEYVKRYSFPKVMHKFHEANLKLVEKELG